MRLQDREEREGGGDQGRAGLDVQGSFSFLYSAMKQVVSASCRSELPFLPTRWAILLMVEKYAPQNPNVWRGD